MLSNKLPVHLPTMEETAQGRFGACPAAAFFPVGAQQVPTNEVRCTKAGTLLLTLCILSFGYSASSFFRVAESYILYPSVKLI